MFFFCWRSGNVVSYQGEWGYELDYIMCNKDITLSDRDGKKLSIEKKIKKGGDGKEVRELEILVRKSKTDQRGKGFRRKSRGREIRSFVWYRRTSITVE